MGGWLPLHIAAQKGQLAVIKYLVSKWPETLDSVNKSQHTAFHCAAREGHLKVVQFLLSQVPHQATMLTSQSQTALHLASARGRYPVVQYLAPIYSAKLLEHRDIEGHTAEEKAGGRVAEFLSGLRQTVIVLQVAVAGLSDFKDWRWRFLGCPRRARLRLDASGLAGEQKAKVTVAQRQSAEWLMGRLATLIEALEISKKMTSDQVIKINHEAPTERLVLLFPNGDHLRGPRCPGRKAKLGHILRPATR
eukprot:symbB.v1.2.001394.t1/scaffold67.1/size356791/20